ncbi:MAG: hypothetical protein AABW58_03600 [Nanoarchaeota archaeon]
MGVEAFIVNLLKIVSVVVAGHVTLTKIIPLLDDMLKGLIKDNKVVDRFTSLLGILVVVLASVKIIEFAMATGNKVIEYLDVLKPGLEFVLNLLPYFGYVFAAIVLIIAVRSFKK